MTSLQRREEDKICVLCNDAGCDDCMMIREAITDHKAYVRALQKGKPIKPTITIRHAFLTPESSKEPQVQCEYCFNRPHMLKSSYKKHIKKFHPEVLQ